MTSDVMILVVDDETEVRRVIRRTVAKAVLGRQIRRALASLPLDPATFAPGTG